LVGWSVEERVAEHGAPPSAAAGAGGFEAWIKDQGPLIDNNPATPRWNSDLNLSALKPVKKPDSEQKHRFYCPSRLRFSAAAPPLSLPPFLSPRMAFLSKMRRSPREPNSALHMNREGPLAVCVCTNIPWSPRAELPCQCPLAELRAPANSNLLAVAFLLLSLHI
jgi:hypothetical protein